MLDWYIPWGLVDSILRLELVIWLAVVVLSYWVFFRAVVMKKPWLRKNKDKKQDP
jgi:hypothetical protein